MARRTPRRTALKQIGMAGVAALLPRGIFRGQSTPITVAGKPVEIAVALVTPSTIRITVLPLEGNAVPDDGALVPAADGKRAGRAPAAERFSPIRAGDLTVRFTTGPPTLHIERRDGRPVQKLTLDSATPTLSFLLPQGPLLGLGAGGPQFDRKGTTDRMRSGQGGYQLRTHGRRVPIQFLIGTDGWGMYIHSPVVSAPPGPQGAPPSAPVFDLSGSEGRMIPPADAAPLDVFITSSHDPATIVGDFATITGRAELPPLWSFGYMQAHRTLAGPERTAAPGICVCRGDGTRAVSVTKRSAATPAEPGIRIRQNCATPRLNRSSRSTSSCGTACCRTPTRLQKRRPRRGCR